MVCPLCRKPTTWEHNPWRPFCSERCKLIDLGHWATEQYRIPDTPLSLDSSPDSASGNHSSAETG
ncbi:MAG: DNA gyrase inhibitor YacG [Nitrospira sp.]